MKTKNRSLNSILLGCLELLVGVLLLVNPEGFAAGIFIALGVVLGILGLRFIILYFRTDAQEAALSHNLVIGLGCIAAGAFSGFGSRWIVSVFAAMPVLYGLLLFGAGLIKLQATVDMLRLKQDKWYLTAVSAVLSVGCGVVIILNPFGVTKILWGFTGGALIAAALVELITVIFFQLGTKAVKEETES